MYTDGGGNFVIGKINFTAGKFPHPHLSTFLTNGEYLKDTSLLSFSALALEVMDERTSVRPSIVEIDAIASPKLRISASISFFFAVSFIVNEACARVT